MKSIDITLGDGWKRDVRYLHGLQDQRPAGAGVNLVEIRDIIDIVVHGRNITSGVEEEHIFSLLTDWTAAVAALLVGHSRKAIVAFETEPWELVVTPAPPDFRMTLYSVDPARRVVIHDISVQADALVSALVEAGSTLIDDLRAISPALEDHETSASLRTSLEKLQAWEGEWRQSVDDVADAAPIRGTTSTPTGLSLSYELSPYRPLQRYGGEHPFDLHSLMCDGDLWLESQDRRVRLGDGLPLLTLFDLLERVDRGVECMEEPHGLPTTLSPVGAHGDYVLEVGANHWRLRAPADRTSREEDEEIVVEVPATDCVEAVATLGEMVADDILERNPRQELNHRLTRAVERVEDLRDWRTSRGDSNLYHRQPEAYLQDQAGFHAATAAAPPPPSFPWSIDALIGAYPTTTWRVSAQRIDFGGIASLADLVLAPTDAGLSAIDRATGHRMWETENGEAESTSFAVTRGRVATESEGSVALRDIETGAVEARFSLGGDETREQTDRRHLLDAKDFEDDERRRLLLIDQRGGVVGVEPERSAVAWQRQLSPARVVGVDTSGPMLAVLGERGRAIGMNPTDGEVLWRVQLGRRPSFGPVTHQGRIYAGTSQSNRDTFTVHALYPYTGRTRWQVRVQGHPVAPPYFVDRWMQVVREAGDGVEVVTFDLESESPEPLWRAAIAVGSTRRIARPLSVYVDGIEHAVFKTADRRLTCRRMPDGHERWGVELPDDLWELHVGVPPVQVRDALLVADSGLSMRDVSSGRELQRLDQTVPAPGYLSAWGELSMLVGERDVGEEREDRLYRIDLDGFLAEVG
jgi:outer membrane protein assembly factor BamB